MASPRPHNVVENGLQVPDPHLDPLDLHSSSPLLNLTKMHVKKYSGLKQSLRYFDLTLRPQRALREMPCPFGSHTERPGFMILFLI